MDQPHRHIAPVTYRAETYGGGAPIPRHPAFPLDERTTVLSGDGTEEDWYGVYCTRSGHSTPSTRVTSTHLLLLDWRTRAEWSASALLGGTDQTRDILVTTSRALAGAERARG